MTGASRFGIPAAVIAACVLYVVCLASDPSLANHDVGWTIHASGELLDGAEFGVDLIDNNPPLIYWLSSAPVALARWVGLPVFVVYHLTVLALLVVCAAFVRRLLRKVVEEEAVRDAFFLVLLVALVVVPGYGFGQRDQLIAALLLPYFVSAGLAAGRRSVSGRSRLVGGLALGLAVSLKPHYALMWFAAELVVAVRRRQLWAWSRLENWAAVAVGSMYVASVLKLTPAYLDSIQDTLAVYHAYDNSVSWLSPQTAVLTLVLLTLVVSRPKGLSGAGAWVTAGAAVAGFLSVVLQRKGFDYHYVPMLVTALLSVFLSLAARLSSDASNGGGSSRRFILGATPVRAGTALVAFAVLAAAWFVRERFPERDEVVSAIQTHARGRPVLYFSSSVDPLFPSLVFTQSDSVSPYSCLWLIAGNYTLLERQGRPFPYRSLDEMGNVEREFVTTVIDAMELEKPGILFFDRNTGKQAFGITDFEFERYFLAEPRFVEILESYRFIGMVGTAMAYERADEYS